MPDDEPTYRVEAPVSNFAGERAGVHFRDGEGEATEAQARRLRDRGYHVPALEDEDAESLQAVDGIGPARAEALAELGIDSLDALAASDADDVADALDGVDAGTVEDWQAQV